jgi:hypothetical protein
MAAYVVIPSWFDFSVLEMLCRIAALREGG